MLKKLLSFTILTFTTISFAQDDPMKNNAFSASGSDQDFTYNVITLVNRDLVYNTKDDKMLSMFVIRKINENVFWIKKGAIYDSDDRVLLNFDIRLKNSKNEPVMQQVSASHGYIIEIIESENKNTTSFTVSIADQNGNKNSDELIFNTKDLNY